MVTSRDKGLCGGTLIRWGCLGGHVEKEGLGRCLDGWLGRDAKKINLMEKEKQL